MCSSRKTGFSDRGSSNIPDNNREGTPTSLNGEKKLVVTGIERQKGNRNRVSVYLNGKYAFSLSELLALEHRIEEGRALTEAEIDELVHRDKFDKAFDAAVRLLAVRPRSESELIQRLRRKGVDENVINEAIDKLRTLGYVNDEDFARFWVQNREQFSPMGSRRLKFELRQKGVESDTVDEVLEDEVGQDEYELAYRAARSKLRSYTGLEYQDFYRRMGGFLSRRGFDYETSSKVIKQLWRELHADQDERSVEN